MGDSTLTVEVFLTAAQLRRALEDDVRTGLSATPKSLPPLWFYDEAGSQLFEEITRLPEYYPTRAERRLLTEHAGPIARLAGADTLVELGAGACDKTRLLLDAMRGVGRLERYIPFDVSDDFLRDAAAGLIDEYEGLSVHAIVGDFRRHLDQIPTEGDRLVAFLGGTIGNLVPTERQRFLGRLNATMGAGDHLLLGADLVKDPATIVAAYDDSLGVTAAFNRNVLSVINHELDADFVPDAFDHVALWNEEERWIEMRLRSRRGQAVRVAVLDLDAEFEAGEDLLTEISAKFRAEQLEQELGAADFTVDAMWGQADGEFVLVLARPAR
ncbi:MAG: L-histidine N(alpha)-methyltransferase [Acidimicrobiales bacterium]